MKAVFIHNITPNSLVTGDGGYKHAYQTAGLIFFDTYLGAALAAYQHHFISLRQLATLERRCFESLSALKFQTVVQREAAEADQGDPGV